MRKIRVTMEIDLDSGDYEVQYNNASNPGEPIDLTLTLAALKRAVFDHEAEAEEDAVLGKSGQAKVVRS